MAIKLIVVVYDCQVKMEMINSSVSIYDLLASISMNNFKQSRINDASIKVNESRWENLLFFI